jgi:primosomal protein N' (replication factor Y) (superfamily II helicase)
MTKSMTVRVIPIRRLPRGLDVFDYTVPPELESTIAVGQLIQIPMRTSQIYGIVLSIHTSKPMSEKIRPVTAIIHPTSCVNEPQLHCWRYLALWYGVSIGTIAKLSLPPLQKRATAAMTFVPQSLPSDVSVQSTKTRVYQHGLDHADALAAAIAPSGQTCIIVPTIADTQSVSSLLPSSITPVLWHSRLTPRQKIEYWLQIRNNHAHVIVSTRSGVFLPFGDLQSIVIDYEHDQGHKQWDQTPRFHVKDVAMMCAHVRRIPVTYMSQSPSIEHVAMQTKATGALPSLSLIHPPPRIVDMRGAYASHEYHPLSLPVQDMISQAKKDVLLLLNRRGTARSFRCLSCGGAAQCNACELPLVYHQKDKVLKCHYCRTSRAVDLECELCGSDIVRLRGYGTQHVASLVRDITPKSHSVTRIDADGSEPFVRRGPSIIVGTNMALPLVSWPDIESVVCVDIDKDLALPEYTSEESVWHLLNKISSSMPTYATLFVQTLNPEHRLFSWMNAPNQMYETVGNERKERAYPPYTYIVRYSVSHKRKAAAQSRARELQTTLGRLVSGLSITASIDGPLVTHPQYYRGSFWYTMLVRLSRDTWMKDLITLNQHIPSDVKIDPRPATLVSL